MIPVGDENPAHRPPLVTASLVVFCILVFVGQLALPGGLERSVWRFGLVPAVLTGEARLPPGLRAAPASLTLLTSMFLHGGVLHLVGNLLYLWVFGNNVEDRLGHLRYLLFYLAAGLAAAALQVALEPGSRLPMVGASGAVSGVLGAYVVLWPHARVLILLPFLPFFLPRIRAGWLLGCWFAMQLLGALAGPSELGGVAFWAHVGGFLFGVAIGLGCRARPVPGGPWGPRRRG
ncbi:MAG: rhomboid family intramembrane serine protease [Geminicoccaceae bacterium]|nr:rhomboid family intramembrane serine protease [Geminicoccaceae bacterium]MDW8370133.1 rhomboid family intramembrane serine protease [Geminicoccaceae bacterium]